MYTSRSTNTTFSHKNEQQDQSELTLLSSTTAIPKLEDDMLSSFPSFSGLIHNPGTANNPLENINPWFNGLISSNGMPYSRGLMQFPLEINNNNWSNNNNNGFPNSTSFLNQMGLGVSSPNNSNASTVSSSSPRLGLNLQAMDFLGNNNSSSFGAQTRPNMSYDVVGEEVISPAGKILSNNNKVFYTYSPISLIKLYIVNSLICSNLLVKGKTLSRFLNTLYPYNLSLHPKIY